MLTNLCECSRRRATMKTVGSTQRTRRSNQASRSDEPEEISARADVWNGYDKEIRVRLSKSSSDRQNLIRSTHKNKKIKTRKSAESRGSTQSRSGFEREQKKMLREDKIPKQRQPPIKTAGGKTKKSVEKTDPQVDFSEALKKPPPDVDLNDFIVRAAMAQTIVNPLLVKKIGNIDDEQANPKKAKIQFDKLDDEMKSSKDSLEEMKKEPSKLSRKGVRWGDHKCVLYETKEQMTLEDEVECAGDLA